MKVVFFGTSSFAARILAFLLDQKVDIRAIVTRTDKPQGRNLSLSFPPVKQAALDRCPHLPLFQPLKASTPEFLPQLQAFDPDLFVVVAYGEIIKQSLLDLPHKGCINIHASLLPRYRGAAPMQRCLMDGAVETGITIIEMTAQMDAGDILASQSIPVPPDMTLGELDDQLCLLGSDLVLRVLREIESGTATKVPQNHQLATFAPKITPQEERIDWSKPAPALHNQIRALSPFPGAWCQVLLGGQIKRLKVKRSHVEPHLSGPPGTPLQFTPEACLIACGEGALRLLEVQLEGKKAMSAQDFVRGIHQPLQFL
jgi:methionyl-tRNA formyltransferase